VAKGTQRDSASRSASSPRTRTPAVTAEMIFDQLAARGHEPLLKKVSGSARFDLVDGERTHRWLVTIDKGDVGVSRRNAAADTVVRADKASFERAFAGELKFFPALLRGEVEVRGDARLLVNLPRLFHGPSDSTRSVT
jgi:alkyl sulfatase BDS1-like metallo-beta-lactamase superfamily hydrolase